MAVAAALDAGMVQKEQKSVAIRVAMPSALVFLGLMYLAGLVGGRLESISELRSARKALKEASSQMAQDEQALRRCRESCEDAILNADHAARVWMETAARYQRAFLRIPIGQSRQDYIRRSPRQPAR